MLALAEDLRISLGIRTGFEVRELPGVVRSSAVTLGWLRPIVLLPGDWQSWNESERRAVLAHEVAHIARGDYAAGVVARLALALHFYHPLVHWMVRRLQLQQELAADADGARLAGGRRAYLLALSRLALGMETCRLAWQASAFLATKGHLIRRIHVLKEQTAIKDQPMTLIGRALTLSLLVAVGLGAAVLRGPSLSKAAETPPAVDKKPATLAAEASTTSNAKSFDLSYIPTKATGFGAVRPAAIFHRADMKQLFGALNAIIATAAPAGTPRLESIDQATVGMYITPWNRKKGQMGRFMMGGLMVRSVDDFDWKSFVRSLVKRFGTADSALVEVRFDGQVYHKATKVPQLGPNACFYYPDARTIVTLDEEEIRRLITQGAGARPEYVRGEDWRQVENGLIAVAIDNHAQSGIFLRRPPPSQKSCDLRRWFRTRFDGFAELRGLMR